MGVGIIRVSWRCVAEDLCCVWVLCGWVLESFVFCGGAWLMTCVACGWCADGCWRHSCVVGVYELGDAEELLCVRVDVCLIGRRCMPQKLGVVEDLCCV